MVSKTSSHGELKRFIAERVGTDTDRYSEATSNERHCRLTAEEVKAVAEELGMGFLTHQTAQEVRNAIMLKVGRDHRVGERTWDSIDLLKVARALEDAQEEK